MSQKPEFPARVFLGLRFGLAFGRGADGLLRIRQRGERGLLGGTQSLHQRLELIFLQFEVQLHAAAQGHKKCRFTTLIHAYYRESESDALNDTQYMLSVKNYLHCLHLYYDNSEAIGIFNQLNAWFWT